MGVRIFSLAKELNMTSKELMAYLETQGHPVKNHMCTIPDTVAQILRDRLPKRQAKLGLGKPRPPGNGQPQAQPGFKPQTTSIGRPSPIMGTAKPIVPPPSIAAKPVVAAAPAAPAPAAMEPEDESGEKGLKDGEKRLKGKDLHPSKKRVFPGSPDFGMEVTPRLAGTRRGLRRLDLAPGGKSPAAVESRVVEITPPISLKDFSSAIGIKANAIISSLMRQGQMIAINSILPEDLIQSIAKEFNVQVSLKKEMSLEEELKLLEDWPSKPEDLKPRPPVVTFMGRVDHGKTSLLDKIRETNVAGKESGGITQHLGAYRVDKGDIHVVFIDTPGHKAFTEMRARGANVTDLVVLVVAADDGPMPQTEEALSHARAANVPILVALNKIDKPNANPNRCRDLLAKLDLIPVEWGGKTEIVEVSALTSLGIDSLLETVSLESQILDLKSDPTRPAIGTVLEAESDIGKGILTTILVQDGTLRVGDYALCGTTHGRIRNMWLNGDQPVQEVPPGTPVQVAGLGEVPGAGDRFYIVSDAMKAREIAENRKLRKRDSEMVRQGPMSLDDLLKRTDKTQSKVVKLILKADVAGSLEVLKKSLTDLSTPEVKVNLLHAAVGGISQTDVSLAETEGALVIGFHVISDERARVLADERHVEVRTYQIIYELIDDIKKAMEGQLAPTRREQVKGHLLIQQVYKASKIGNIAGCRVTDGTITRTDKIRLARDGRVIYTGEFTSLKRFKDDVRDVREGFECGVKIANYEDIKEGDVIESYAIVEEKRIL